MAAWPSAVTSEKPMDDDAIAGAIDRYRLAVPPSIQHLRLWLVWRFEPAREPGKKALKVPHYAGSGARRSGVQGSPEDRAQLVTFEEALTAFAGGRWSGLGIALVTGCGLVAYDLDNCATKTDGIAPVVNELLHASGTYCELSPSGGGVRILALGAAASVKKLHPKGWNVERFGDSGFVTVTGHIICGEDVAPLSESARATLETWLASDEKAESHSRQKQLDEARALDPVYQHIKARGVIRRDWQDGRSSIECPFASEHTGGSGFSDTVYFLPHTHGYAKGHFRCLHAHCADRVDADFLTALEYAEASFEAFTQADAPAVHVPIDWAEIGRTPPPPREWAIADWVGMGHVTLQAGRGGVGKTLILQQQLSCASIGKAFLGAIDECLVSLAWCAEDDAHELARRQIAIAGWLNVPIGMFKGFLHVYALAGVECALMTHQGHVLKPTKRATELWEQINDHKARVVGLDNIAHLFAGNENDRYEVTTFVNMLTGMCIAANAAIILNAHPGKAAESEFSGSTAWENAARGRLYLSRTPPGEDDSNADDAGLIRYLSRRKANYSGRDSKRFVYQDGTLRPDDEPIDNSPFIQGLKSKKAHRVVLDGMRKLKEMGIFGNHSSSTPNYLPKILISYALTEGLHVSELERSMRELMKAGEIKVERVGQYANRTPKYGLVIV